MPYEIDETHDPNLESWVESANDPATDFPIQNLPWVFVQDLEGWRGEEDRLRCCVRIGDQLLDLERLSNALYRHERFDPSSFGIEVDWMMLRGRPPRTIDSLVRGTGHVSRRKQPGVTPQRELRGIISTLLRRRGRVAEAMRPIVEKALRPASDCSFGWHEQVRDYTDFYASVFHATNVGSMFRPDNPLLPNYKHVPIAYHGRASTVVPSGTDIVRPIGQQAPAEEGGSPGFGPSKLFDYELEVGVVVGRGNELGTHIPIEEAEDHILGLCLLNDWSARDLQKWEYQPLGPFLAKNFATTVSPYIVTMEALAPFRCPAYERPAGDPRPLGYLTSDANTAHGGVDLTLEVYLSSEQMRTKGMDPVRISKGSFRDMYWTIGQMLTHHSVNGCAMQPGDLLGSGTVSNKTRDSRGCLLELTWDGDSFSDPPVLVPGTQRTPITLPTGEERKFLADGDEVILKGYCEREGFRRIGFGECRGIVRPARQI